MRAGFTVVNFDTEGARFILLHNIESLNEVINVGYFRKETILKLKNQTVIGFWRIKRKETIK